jgi:hypothetical protein
MVLLEKMLVSQQVAKFPQFYATRRFITVFTRARQWSLSWATLISSCFLMCILILSSHLRPDLSLKPCETFQFDFYGPTSTPEDHLLLTVRDLRTHVTEVYAAQFCSLLQILFKRVSGCAGINAYGETIREFDSRRSWLFR